MRAAHTLGFALLGAMLGLAAHAWGQSTRPGDLATAFDPSTLLLLELIREGGLPMVLALLCGLLARGIPLQISLSEEDRTLLRQRSRHGCD